MSHVPPGREDAHEVPRQSPARDQPAVPVTVPERLRASARHPVIAVDAMGGDYAPDEIVAGALAAQREHGVTTLLTGPPARLRPVITSQITRQVSRHEQGAAIGISGSLSSLAMTIAPPISGSLIGLAGPVDHIVEPRWLVIWTLVPATAAAIGLIAALIARARGQAEPAADAAGG